METGARWHLGVVVHHPDVAEVMQVGYSPQTFGELRHVLDRLGTLDIKALPTGLPQAGESRANSSVKDVGYDFVWTRDAAFVANMWCVTGANEKAATAVHSLIGYYAKPEQMRRMRATVEGTAKGRRGIDRPHIKFDGNTLTDGKVGKWEHAQNDALGLLLWLSFRSANQGVVTLDDRQLEPLALLAAYLAKIDFTTDKEAGHWEEMGEKHGRVQASTLRCVIAGLQELERWADERPENRERLQKALDRGAPKASPAFSFSPEKGSLEQLLDRGTRALHALLPLESDGSGIYRRGSDTALLSALYLDAIAAPEGRVIDAKTRDEVISRFVTELRGSHGDRRYTGDGYWALAKGETDPAAKKKLNSATLEQRVRMLEPGGEAQWTMSSGLLSAIYGAKYLESGDPKDLAAQTHELNRALGMITGPQSRLGEGTIPESYMQVRSDPSDPDSPFTFTENPLPLNWSKANLALAIEAMQRSLEKAAGHHAGPVPAELWACRVG
jgi:phosphorylase kinase alpha/beta subunit